MCNMYLKFTYFRVFTSIEKPIWPIQSLAQNILKKKKEKQNHSNSVRERGGLF